MPFDEEYEDQSAEQTKKNTRLKKISTQPSIFDAIPKKPSADELKKQVEKFEERLSNYKSAVVDLGMQFNKVLSDKTLRQNKSIFQHEMEKELLIKMVNLGTEINNDKIEQEGAGAMAWIMLLFKTCLRQRDRINNLEYTISQIEKKVENTALAGFISKEIKQVLDKKKDRE